jgi:hypothetical protein
MPERSRLCLSNSFRLPLRNFLSVGRLDSSNLCKPAGTDKQAQRVAEITGHQVHYWMPPPEQGKDLAEYTPASKSLRVWPAWQKSAAKPWNETRVAIASLHWDVIASRLKRGAPAHVLLARSYRSLFSGGSHDEG